MFDSNQLRNVSSSIKVYAGQLNFYITGTSILMSSSALDSSHSHIVIDSAEVVDERGKEILKVRGWAADLIYKLPMKSLMVIKNQKIISLVKTMTPRPDVASNLESFVDGFGFEFKLPYNEKDEIQVCFVRPSNTCDIKTLSKLQEGYELIK